MRTKRNKLLKLIWIFILYVVLELSLRSFSLQKVVEFILAKPKVNFISFLYLCVLLIFIMSLLNNYVYSYIVLLITTLSLAIGNYQKIKFRSEPLFLFDIENIISLPDLLGMLSRKEFIFLIFFIVLSFILLLLILIHYYDKIKHAKIFKNIFYRFLIMFLSFVCIVYSFHINYPNNILHRVYKQTGYEAFVWNPLKTYQENGFIAGFLHNFPGEIMQKPENYSKESMLALKDKYQEVMIEINQNRENDNFEAFNILLLLSESFADPSVFSEFSVTDVVLPYISNDSDKTMHGKLIVPIYGGATANTEFEILTSMSVKNLMSNMNLPYQHFLANMNHVYSLVNKMNESDVHTFAAHNCHSKFYKRRRNFDVLAFQEQLFVDDMTYIDKYPHSSYVSDRSAYQEMLSYLKDDHGSFVHFITMQNHTPFHYHEGMLTLDDVSVPNELNQEEVLSYLSKIKDTDRFTEELTQALDKLDRKTILVFYGDHHPPLYGPILNDDNLEAKYTTNFFIYTNFDTKIKRNNIKISTDHLAQLIYEVADVKVDEFQAFHQLYAENIQGRVGDVFIVNDEHLTYDELDDSLQELVDDYYMIQYDILVGNEYFLDRR